MLSTGSGASEKRIYVETSKRDMFAGMLVCHIYIYILFIPNYYSNYFVCVCIE